MANSIKTIRHLIGHPALDEYLSVDQHQHQSTSALNVLWFRMCEVFSTCEEIDYRLFPAVSEKELSSLQAQVTNVTQT
jgi:hypothetical protein